MRDKRIFLITAIVIFGSGLFLNCAREKKDTNPFVEEMDGREKMRYRQYMIKGKRLYNQQCANCHGTEGDGLKQLIPPLANSDYLMADIERAVCQIRNGAKGEMIVNGRSFDQVMPANNELRALEIAEIVTYITNSWGNQKGITSTRDVENTLSRCNDKK